MLTVEEALAPCGSSKAVAPGLAPAHRRPGLRLAEDIAPTRDQPPFDKSLVDGYAVRSR